MKTDSFNNQCPICNSSSSNVVYTVNSDRASYTVLKCSNCEHYYSGGDLDIEEDLYNDEVYKVIDNRGSVYAKIIDRESEHVLKVIGHTYPLDSNLLDFGSGKGNFLAVAKSQGFQVTGIETAKERAEFAEEKFGLNIIKSFYTGGKIQDKPFDIITLFHVLEHLPKPQDFLAELAGHNLDLDGILVIEVPNFSSWQSAIAKNKWMHLDIPRHISHFTRKRLLKLVSDLNMKVIKTEYFSWHLGVLGMCQSVLSLFGYRKKIIKELKHYNVFLMLALTIVLPVAVIMEFTASAFNRGGIIRIYLEKN